MSQNRTFLIILAVIALAGGAFLVMSTRASGPVELALDPNEPPPNPQGYLIGSPEAPVEVVMFADFECPGCGQFATLTEPDVRSRLVATGQIRFRFVDMPIGSHPNALVAHNAAACANAQGKFWEMHDLIYHGQSRWSALLNGPDSRNPEKVMRDYAAELSLDAASFATCLRERTFAPQIGANRQEAVRLQVPGTPTFLFGSRLIWEVLSYDKFKALVDSARAAGTGASTFGKN